MCLPLAPANSSKATDILISRKHCFHGRQQVAAGSSFNNITQRTQAERFLHYILGGFLGQVNYLGVWNEFANSPAGLNSIQTGRPISSRIISGLSSSAFWTAANPSESSQTTSNSVFCFSAEQTKDRNGSKSSTTRIRIRDGISGPRFRRGYDHN